MLSHFLNAYSFDSLAKLKKNVMDESIKYSMLWYWLCHFSCKMFNDLCWALPMPFQWAVIIFLKRLVCLENGWLKVFVFLALKPLWSQTCVRYDCWPEYCYLAQLKKIFNSLDDVALDTFESFFVHGLYKLPRQWASYLWAPLCASMK